MTTKDDEGNQFTLYANGEVESNIAVSFNI
jgi:hypothetical protein